MSHCEPAAGGPFSQWLFTGPLLLCRPGRRIVGRIKELLCPRKRIPADFGIFARFTHHFGCQPSGSISLTFTMLGPVRPARGEFFCTP